MVLTKSNQSLYFFYFLVLSGLIAVFFTTPFLRFPYDPIAHLIAIDELYNGAETTTTSLQSGRLIWHSMWANIFHIFEIDSMNILLRAKIIHVSQTFIALFSIYYFSHVIIRNIFKKMPFVTLKYLSLWSVIVWLVIFSTFSVNYHLVWNIWYSLTYQVTLPLFWYIIALTLVLFLEETSKWKKIFFILQIFSIGFFILRAHSMELMYFFMYVGTFALIYIEKFYKLIKKYCCAFVLSLSIIIVIISKNFYDKTNFFYFISKAIEKNDPTYLYAIIMEYGQKVIENYNRSSHVINELSYYIFYLALVSLTYFLWKVWKQDILLNIRLFIFILITSLFIIIPIYTFPAGLFSLISRGDVVHRIHFSSSLFVLVPILTYYLVNQFTDKLRYVNLFILISLVSVFGYSWYSPNASHNYAKNVVSLKNSFSKEKYNFHLSQKQIEHIGKAIDHYEDKNPTNKETYYFARPDIGFVLKYFYGKNVHWLGRRKNYNHERRYWDHYQWYSQYYHCVAFHTPGSFPIYKPYR